MIKKLFKQNSHNILFKWVSGFGISMYRIYENRNHRIESNGELTILKKLARMQPKMIFDGGTNIGNYTRFVRSLCSEATIYCFEPVPDTFDLLKNNLKDDKNVYLINKGLYHENGWKKIHIYPSNTHASVYDITSVPYQATGSLEIGMIRGDDFVSDHKIQEIDFLKLDLEDAEYDALKGFEKTLEKGNIKMIQFEYGYINILSKHLLIDYYRFFNQFGYRVGKIFPKKVEFREYQYRHEDFIGPNFVAVKKTEKDLIDLLKK
ncbi:MAG: FkbM family methyltransferase [Bacteroidales bacterium]|nr:FkbM family methyltransferase [Bacteroidales bacterium]